MPANEGLKPEVVEPGDEVTLPVETTLRSYAGHWRATARATVLNAQETGAPRSLAASSNVEPWPKALVARDKKDPTETAHAWARVTIRNDAALGGKTLRLRLALDVTYLAPAGKNVTAQVETVYKEADVALTEAGTQALARDTWQISKWVGWLCCVLGGVG